MKVHEVKRGDSHRDQMAYRYHRCPIQRRPYLLGPDGVYDTSKMDSEDDRLEFAIGVYGEGLPQGVPFQVTAICPACGDAVTEWFSWKRVLLTGV